LWKSQNIEKNPNFLGFVKKNDALMGNFQSSVLKGFIATLTPMDVLCSNVVKFG